MQKSCLTSEKPDPWDVRNSAVGNSSVSATNKTLRAYFDRSCYQNAVRDYQAILISDHKWQIIWACEEIDTFSDLRKFCMSVQ